MSPDRIQELIKLMKRLDKEAKVIGDIIDNSLDNQAIFSIFYFNKNSDNPILFESCLN